MPGAAGQGPSHPPFLFESHQPAEEKARLFERFRAFAAESGWSVAIANEVELILEEWFSNVIDYGLTGCANPSLQVECMVSKDEVTLRISDNGIPFDPTKHPDPDFTRPAEERPVGGLGLFMVKKLAKSISYERTTERNILIVRKDLLRPALRHT